MASGPGSWVAAGLRLVSLAERRSRGSGRLRAPSKARAGVPLARLRCSLRAWAFIPEMGGAQGKQPEPVEANLQGPSAPREAPLTPAQGRGPARERLQAPPTDPLPPGQALPTAPEPGSRAAAGLSAPEAPVGAPGHTLLAPGPSPRGSKPTTASMTAGSPYWCHLTPGPCPATWPILPAHACVHSRVRASCCDCCDGSCPLNPCSPRGSREAAL